MLDEQEKEHLRRSWRLVLPIADTAADLFYKRLFELRPEYQALFPADMRAQKRKLMQMLAFVMHSLDWPENAWRASVPVDEDLLLVVLALGRRHRDLYKIPDAAYEAVGEALLWTLDYGLGTAFTDEVKAAWLKVYRLLVATMRMGAALSERCEPPPRDRAMTIGAALIDKAIALATPSPPDRDAHRETSIKDKEQSAHDSSG